MTRNDFARTFERARGGDGGAQQELYECLYADLEPYVHKLLRQASVRAEWQTTALINEAFLRLVPSGRGDGSSRAHFTRVAARTLRNIVVDTLRRQREAPPGAAGDEQLALLDGEQRSIDVLALHEALERMRTAPELEELVEVVDLRMFAQAGEQEIADLLGVSVATVKRRWTAAISWLQDTLDAGSRR